MKRIVMLVSALALAALAVGIGRSSAPEPDQEAISVHGHWTIEVIDADGTTASVHEFENALDSSGNLTLPQLLARERQLEFMGIEVAGPTAAEDPCNDSAGNPANCFIVEGETSGANRFGGLSVSVVGFAGAAHLALAGDMVVQNTTTITHVGTRTQVCSGETCLDNRQFAPFTGKALEAAIPVSEGQTVHVEVDISFS